MMSQYKIIIALTILVSCCKCNEVESFNCNVNQWSVHGGPGKPSYCLDCSDCPPGHELTPRCATHIPHGTTTGCTACVKGETFSTELSTDSCKPCNICGKNRQILQDCELNRNTVCGECKKGYYEAITGECKLCQHCCINSQDSVKNDKCVRDGEKHCTADTRCQPKQKKVQLELSNNGTTLINGSTAEKTGQSTKDDNRSSVTREAVASIVSILVVVAVVVALYMYYRCSRQDKGYCFWMYSAAPQHDCDVNESTISVTCTVKPVQEQQDESGSTTTGRPILPYCIVILPDKKEDMCDTSESSSSKTASRDTVSSVVETASGSSSRSATPPLDTWYSCGQDQEPLSIEEESCENKTQK